MDRRLLPYEYQLIEALGVSKEEYLEFVALQQEYKDPKAGTELDVRNEVGTIALVLTIVGTLFQVGAALLAPKPSIPDLGADNKRRNRQQRFSPSSGFNSAPELAFYGDPVNLVYTDKITKGEGNPNGGVRVSGSLVWSSIDNYGSSQFMQLLFVIGAARIINLSHKRTAFGSLAIDQLDPATTFLFYKDEEKSRAPRFDDFARGDLDLYPDDSGRAGDGNREVCQVITPRSNKGAEGFSQAYSPTTSSSLGIYDPIPVRVEMTTRDTEGEEQFAPIGVTLEQLDWTNPNFEYKKDREIKVRFESSGYTGGGDDEAVPLAVTFRRQAVNALDFGSTYMLGSAKFRLISFGNARDIEDGDVDATFRCVEDGICPSAPYDRESPIRQAKEQKQILEQHLKVLKNIREDNEAVPGEPVKDDKESIEKQYVKTGIVNNYELGGCSAIYNFRKLRPVSWMNELDKVQVRDINPGGSLELTIEREKRALANPPTINGKDARRELNSDLRKAKRLISEIQAGDYDESTEPLAILGNQSLSAVIEAALSEEEDQTAGKINVLNGKIETVLNNKKNLRSRIKKAGIKRSKKVKDDALTGRGDPTNRFPDYADLTGDGLELANKFLKLENRIAKLRGRITKINNATVNRARNRLVKQLLDFDGRFVDIKGNEYAFGGIAQMEERKDNFPTDRRIPDLIGVAAIEAEFEFIKAEKRNTIDGLQDFLKNWEDCLAAADNNFFVKALVKAESAAYETMSEVDQVKFSIKSKLFRRISGRQKKYGETKASKKYSRGDNGIHGRQAFFRFSYKKGSDNSFRVHPVLFSLRQASESDAYNDFNFLAPNRDRYVFKLEPVYDVASELKLNGQKTLVVLNSNEKIRSTGNGIDSGLVWYKGEEISPIVLEERGPKLINEWDVFSVNTDTQIQFSFENGPELALTAVTEQQIQDTRNTYKNLSVLGLSMFAGRNVQDLRNVTVFAEEGKQSYKVDNFDSPSDSSTSYAPDIFVDTVLDKENGIGKYAPPAVLDQDSLKLAKKFCKQNNLPVHPEGSETPTSIRLFMDCVIADNSSWREFWVSNAPFSLLEFARKNGKETLVPIVPVNGSGKAAEDDGRPISLTISALFTTGNILEDSYKEEFLDYGASTQELIASIVYREESSKSVFQRKRTVQVERKNTNANKAIRETFDASGFITSRQQAILFGKMLVNQRKFIRRGIEFKTFPSNNPIEPGAFIYVDIGLNSWDRSSSGVIAEGGALNSPLQDKISDGTYSFLLYNQDDKKVDARSSISVSGGVASSLRGRVKDLYVMGIKSGQKRVFRITEVEMDQDGEVTVRAIEYPCDDEQRASVADFRPELFDVS